MKEIKQIRVFISSPGDLQQERDLAAEVCDQITSDLGSQKGFVVDPIRWESHTVSARAERSQLAISEQLGQYDIYLGIMGYYFGTSTGAYASGTEEEFEDALRLNVKTGTPWISFYFSSAKVDLDKVDLGQYQLVKDFRKKLREQGVFYQKFEDLTQFQTLVRSGITKAILETLEKAPEGNTIAEHVKSQSYKSLRPYEVLRHFRKEFECNPNTAVHVLFTEATKNLTEFTSYLNTVSGKLDKVARAAVNAVTELERVDQGKSKSMFKLEKLIGRFFNEMSGMIDWFAYNISNMERSFMQAMADFQRAVIIIRETSNMDESDLQSALQAATSTRSELKRLGEISVSSGENIPEVESLGGTWEVHRRMYKAITKDFSEFLEASVDTITEIERYIKKPT